MKKLLLVLLLSTGLYASQENTDDRSFLENTTTNSNYNYYDSDNDTELALLLSTEVYASQENNQLSQLNLDFLNKYTKKEFDDLLLGLDPRDLEFDQSTTEHISISKESSINLKDTEEEKEEDIDSFSARIEKDITHKSTDDDDQSNFINKRKKPDINPTSTTTQTHTFSSSINQQFTTNSINHTTAGLNSKTAQTNTEEKPHQCTQCDYSTSRTSDLKKHIKRRHTGEKPFKCTQCDKHFCNSSDLTRHMQTHTGDRPYQCTQCDKGFAQKIHLTRHIRAIHNNEKPHQCPHCDYSTSRTSDLKKHIKRRHKQEEDPSN